MASVAMEQAIENFKARAARAYAPTPKMVITPKGKTLYSVRRVK